MLFIIVRALPPSLPPCSGVVKGHPLDFSADAGILDVTPTVSPMGHYSNTPALRSLGDKSRPRGSKHAGRLSMLGAPLKVTQVQCVCRVVQYIQSRKRQKRDSLWNSALPELMSYLWKHWLQAQIKVGHVQPLQADLASGCPHFLKNCRQQALLTPSPFPFSADFAAAKKPKATRPHGKYVPVHFSTGRADLDCSIFKSPALLFSGMASLLKK